MKTLRPVYMKGISTNRGTQLYSNSTYLIPPHLICTYILVHVYMYTYFMLLPLVHAVQFIRTTTTTPCTRTSF